MEHLLKLDDSNDMLPLVAVIKFNSNYPGMGSNTKWEDIFAEEFITYEFVNIKFTKSVSFLTKDQFGWISQKIKEITSTKKRCTKTDWEIEFDLRFNDDDDLPF